MLWLLSFIISLYGGVALRLHGGGFLKPRDGNKRSLPKGVLNLIATWPFGLVAYFLLDFHTDFSNLVNAVLSLLCLGLCIAGRASGHGQYISMGFYNIPTKPEKLDFIVKWFFGDDPRALTNNPNDLILNKTGKFDNLYWRCLFGNAITGLAAVSGIIMITIISQQYLLTMAFILGGILKGLAYAISWMIYPNGNGRGLKNFNEATQIAEFMTGVFAYLPLGLAIWTLYGTAF
jgi:hypothetical protein